MKRTLVLVAGTVLCASFLFPAFASGPQDDQDVKGAAEVERYDNMAFPSGWVDTAQQQGAALAFQLASTNSSGSPVRFWRALGPSTDFVSALLAGAYTSEPGASSFSSGRVTALALSPNCPEDCKLLLGAAGGGVWLTENPLAPNPEWHPASDGIPSNAIGSLAFDPNDPHGRTVYVGTGEPNGSGDSEAGVGLYKTVDLGKHWTLVPGSFAVSNGRSIGAVAIDPVDANHIFIGTAVARHGSSSVNGGRFTPPNAPTIGLYESKDGGASFNLVFSVPSDTVTPGSATGNDFFRGGVTRIVLDRAGLQPGQPSRIFLSVFDYGVYRNINGSFEQVFVSPSNGNPAASSFSRTQFAIAALPSGAIRMYVGDSATNVGLVYRSDNVLLPLASVTWTQLSSATPGTPGYATYNFCEGQCSYDMWVEASATNPDEVWVAGSMEYGELFGGSPSNGRAVMRSTDAGVHFADMTDDAQAPTHGIHPDQHYVALIPRLPGVAFIGSDGGLVRTNGRFVDVTSQCATRGVTGANLADCQMWLSAIPQQIINLNPGLNTLQFQSVSVSNLDPVNDLMGGTQDNGTLAHDPSGSKLSWFETIFGDGGQSGIDIAASNVRMHTYTGASPDVNFNGAATLGWDWIGDPLQGEAASFYIPLINDPAVSGSWFAGLQHVWRTQDNGGAQAVLDLHCGEFTGDFTVTCGDWVPLGVPTLSGTAFGTDKGGSTETANYVVAVSRAPGNSGTLWAATRRGRLFISTNADTGNPASVIFTRIDTASQPSRFISGIAVDDRNPNHAWVSFSGYNAYTPTTPGHLFEVTYNPAQGTATWTDISYNLNDLPITAVVRDSLTGDLFAATDFGVLALQAGTNLWTQSGASLPPAAVYGLTIHSGSRLLYAATHGRGIYRLDLGK